MSPAPLDEQLDFDLDALEVKNRGVFRFKLEGRVITLSDPNRVDWKILAEMQQPIELLKHVANLEDREWLREHPIPIEDLKRVMDKYAQKFELPEMGKGAGSVI
jgi:nicotinic acid phosphoribosyltransferase